MSPILFGIIIIIIVFAALMWVIISVGNWSLGSLSGTTVYTDTDSSPGDILYSDRLQLKGKPDYIVKEGSHMFPVEVKTGRTPDSPYQNHIMQLMAYCALIEETYQNTPEYGIIKYPEREFKIAYTEERKEAINQMLQELIRMKKSGIEPQCTHPYHQ